MSAEPTPAPLTDEELLFGPAPEAPPAPRLYDDWDWGQASKDEVSREVTHLLQYRARLEANIAETLAAGQTPDPYFTGELAKVETELTLLSPAAAKYRIPMEVKPQ